MLLGCITMVFLDTLTSDPLGDKIAYTLESSSHSTEVN